MSAGGRSAGLASAVAVLGALHPVSQLQHVIAHLASLLVG